jgi:hypothetical protein
VKCVGEGMNLWCFWFCEFRCGLGLMKLLIRSIFVFLGSLWNDGFSKHHPMHD